ncbi:MAG: hypothetical protein K5682_04610 [Lachnospiraceae bacterium]|nr:hypothetical protein [Lachnospiraceae bacterium]
MQAFDFFDIFLIIIGVYVLVVVCTMKATGKLSNNMLVGRNVKIETARDPKGFIDAIFKKTIICGIANIVCGCADFINVTLLGGIWWFKIPVMIVYVIVMVWYTKESGKAQQDFLM